MRLVSFGPLDQERLGALIDNGNRIVDLNAADSSLPKDMLTFLRGDFWEKTRRLLADTSKLPGKAVVPAGSVRLGAPVPRPGLIVCIGLNYKDHADEQGHEYPKAPLLFGKSPMAAAGPNDDVVYPEGIEQLDYEVELGVIIGKTAKKVSASDARKYIAGYCTFHDVSARCAQFGDKQWFRGKSFDTFAPFGPALVTPDEAGDPHNLKVTCKVNGEVRQNSNTSKLIHNVDRIIEYISRGHTLSPGDVIATGTPAGVGVFLKPPKLLKRGDVVELEVEKLGKVVNRIV
ncbi:MAG TPA: fumarylacetoacetate hydrolase family protein [Planctomycetota bacterium]|nr:fumarylacetoacetate hydrolase family protein [Planctomycetota bacterium]